MSGRPVGQEVLWAVIFGFAVTFGVGLRRWKGDAFRTNVVSNVVMWVGTAVGYFLVADQDDDAEDDHTDAA